MYIRGVSKSSWNHPEVMEVEKPETSFWYVVHKTSLQSHCAKLHISPTIYWLSTDQNYMVYDTEIHNEKSVSRNELPTIIHLNVWAPRKCTLGAFYRDETTKINFYTNLPQINAGLTCTSACHAGVHRAWKMNL